jgi:hypothetical protein
MNVFRKAKIVLILLLGSVQSSPRTLDTSSMFDNIFASYNQVTSPKEYSF